MVQDATLATDIWTTIRSTLVAGAIETTTGSSTETVTIASSYNDRKTSSPQVIIYPIEREEGSWKFGSNEGKKFINISLEAYAENTRLLDQIEDQIISLIKNTEIEGIELIGITSAYAYNNPALVKYHSKDITLTYDRE